MKKIYLLLIGLVVLSGVKAQKAHYSEDPMDVKIVTEDVDRFWEAFAQMEALKEKTFEEYFAKGTDGLKGFTPHRLVSPEALYHKVQERKEDYIAGRDLLKDLESKRKRIRAIYTAMEYWYPEAVYPPIYFIVGRFNTGGTVSEAGLLLGAEMYDNLESIPPLVAHELIHYQQETGNPETLLLQSLGEGAADFIGELISGGNINYGNFQYGQEHLEDLCLEFALLRKGKDNIDWLYGTSGRDARPNDLGYWMGYKIIEAYFYKQKDKHAAIERILKLNEENAEQFLKESGFLDPYIKEVSTWSDEKKKEFLTKKAPVDWSEEEQTAYLKDNNSGKTPITFMLTVPQEDDDAFITGSHAALGNWKPNVIKLKKTGKFTREITLNVDLPIQFKFTRGNWPTQAIVKDRKSMGNIKLDKGAPKEISYEIETWADRFRPKQ